MNYVIVINFIWSNAWTSLGREDAVERLTSKDKCVLQMGIVCI
jgi:hypothetical protein